MKAFGATLIGSGPTSEGDLVLISKTAAAAGIAWAVGGQVTGAPNPVLAPLAAVLVVEATIYQTLQSGLRRVVGVVLGVLLALALGRSLGLNAWSLTFVLLLALVVGRMARLGGQTSQVAVSALLVMAIGDAVPGYAQERVYETLLGALVGVLVNALIAPPVHVHAARDSLAAMARKLSRLLVDIGEQLSREDVVFAPARTKELLWTARDFHDQVAEIRQQLDRASESLRYNPRRSVFVSPARKPAPAALLVRAKAATEAVDHIVDQTSGIARALADIGEGRAGADWDTVVAARVGKVVTSIGNGVDTWSRALVADDPDASERPGEEPPRQQLIHAIEEARAQLASLSQHMAAHGGDTVGSTTTSWLVVGSVLADLSRILAEIDPVGGAHRTAVSTTPAGRLHLLRPTFSRLRRKLRAARGRLRRGG
ncbi:FUSC family protein [Saccharopolyspora rhizosphaerae]|uniref:FUSC family protein n=1 Tax=Saccharopolyspora rhizosphaerae TaxID=2492662 RepID=UPI001F45587E|nr:FUSC family protein [Saccharopolyspora rhizosphaerae]